METAQHVAQVTQSLESIQPGGAGHVSSIRVRLLHATVRRHILKLAEARPEYYDVKAFGVPANDLDTIATIGAFSSLLIWKGLPRQGVLMRPQEIEDYIALWRLVAHYLGTPTEPYESAETARAWLESIVAAEMKPNDKSAVMANNIITAMANTPPAYVSLEFSRATARWLNGRELSDSLKIENAGWYHWALLLGTNIFMATWVYFARAFPAFDKWQIAMSRKEGWENLMDEKNGVGKETKFTFEHVPGYSKETDVAQPPEQQSSWKFKPGIEMMGALGLLMATMVLFAVLLAGAGVVLQLHHFFTARYVSSI
ncbi:hypothetical protein KEM55_005547 [Ascosphaera atra]|nr:hypothetical protein KEM55_005547 [Ascosphaera atra]